MREPLLSPITTERLVLRPLNENDAEFIFALYNSEPFLLYIGDRNIRSIKDAKEYIASGPQAMYQNHHVGLLLIEHKTTKEKLGVCGLLKRDWLDNLDIGFGLMPEFMNQGYGYEAAIGVLNDVKQRLNTKTVVAIVQDDNASSIRLLEKLSFQYIKDIIEPNSNETLCFYQLNQ